MTGREELFQELLQQGHSAAWDLDWPKAVEAYQKALSESPDHPVALTSLGLALLETGQLQEALSTYLKAAKVSPEDPVPVEKCAEVFELLGQEPEAIEQRGLAADLHARRRDVEKALENWSHIARLQPANLVARSRLALTYERLGRKKEAIQEYLATASILQSSGKLERAQEATQRALTLAPGDPDASAALRLLRKNEPLPPPKKPRTITRPLRQKRQAARPTGAEATSQEVKEAGEAEAQGEAVVELADPEEWANRKALSMLAGMLFEEPGGRGKEGGASGVASLAKASRSKRAAATQLQALRYLGEALDLRTRGHKRRACKLMERAVETGLDHPAAHYVLAVLLKESGGAVEAQKHFVASIGNEELAFGANVALGRLAHAKGNLAEAASYLLQGLRLADCAAVEENQAEQLSRTYDTVIASQSEGNREALSRLVDGALQFLHGPQWLDRVHQARRQLLARSSEDQAIVPIAEILSGGGSEQIVSAENLINQLAERGLLASAAEETMLAIQHAPSYLPLHMRLAELMISSGRTEAGVQKMALIAQSHEMRGEVKKAADVLKLILGYSPVDVAARQHLIRLLMDQDRPEEALDQYLNLSDLYRQMAQIDEARDTLDKALQFAKQVRADRSRQLAILQRLSDIDLAHLDWRRALADQQELRDLTPEDDKPRRAVIDLHLRLGQEDSAASELDNFLDLLVKADLGTQALALLEELTREYPGKQMLHARLAEAYRAAGRMADAIAQYDALGEIQLEAGQVREAIRTISTIVELKPPDIDGYRELLRNLESSLK